MTRGQGRQQNEQILIVHRWWAKGGGKVGEDTE